jgi:hypothetical protein
MGVARHQEKLSISEIIGRLEAANSDLNAVLGMLHPLVAWWTSAEMELNCLAKNLHDPNADRIQLVSSQRNLQHVSHLYQQYVFEVLPVTSFLVHALTRQ